MKKVVGILGGMGPEATCDLFLKIIRNTPAEKDQDHLRVLIDSNPQIPDRTAFITGKGEDPRPLLIQTAKNLEAMGASFLAIPCNTAHYFYDDIKREVGIPVLHIMEEVGQVLSGQVKRVGLLASTGTVRTGLYQKVLSKKGITVIIPEGSHQDAVMTAIYKVKGHDLDHARVIALEEGKKLADQGAEAVISGCTEIPLVLHDGDLRVKVLDATEVLAKACVEYALYGR